MKFLESQENVRKSLEIDFRTFQSSKYDPESESDIYQLQRFINVKSIILQNYRNIRIVKFYKFEEMIRYNQKWIPEAYRA